MAYFAANWWLRSPNCNSSNGATNALNVNSNGNWNNNNCSNTYGVRPALMDQPDRVGPRGPKAVPHHQRRPYPVQSLRVGSG